MVQAVLAKDYGQAFQAKLGRDPVSVYRLK
jgi:hypothetical protein